MRDARAAGMVGAATTAVGLATECAVRGVDHKCGPLRGDLVEELEAFVADIVDGIGDGTGVQVSVVRPAEQVPQLVGVLVGGVEPGVVMVGREGAWHAGMDAAAVSVASVVMMVQVISQAAGSSFCLTAGSRQYSYSQASAITWSSSGWMK